MISKVKELLGSIRFWQLTAGLILAILAYYKVLDQTIVELIASYLGISIAVRTFDKAVK